MEEGGSNCNRGGGEEIKKPLLRNPISKHPTHGQQDGTGRMQAKVARERSFMRTQHGAAAAGQNRSSPRGVQRQRSCVASLYTSNQGHRPVVSSSSMPAAATASYIRPKPDMRLYRPPTLRVANNDFPVMVDGSQPINGRDHHNHVNANTGLQRSGLNINAKEFVSLSPTTAAHVPQSALKHSKSSSQVSRAKITTKTILGNKSPPLRVHFTDDTTNNDLENKASLRSGGVSLMMKRSNSVGCAADLKMGVGGDRCSPHPELAALSDLAPIDKRSHEKLEKVAKDPVGCGARVIMEAVRELLAHVVTTTRHADAAARYCLAIVEKEGSNGNFIETLQNTCQEYFQERQTLLPLVAPPQQPNKWIGYITFLLEMYSQLKHKRRNVSNLLLSLIAECCIVTLSQTGPPSLQQTECLFFTLTVVGRDLEAELPSVMCRVIASARDALFASSKVPSAVRKTLMQLIEMNAANWQLSGTAVMYYHPSVSVN